MHTISRWNNLSVTIVIFSCLLLRCALSGSIIDQGRFETKLNDIRLVDHPTLKIYHGGSIHEISLKIVNTIVIDPSVTVTVDNELYYSADITLKDGTRMKSLDKDESTLTKAFISVHNTLAGKNDHDTYEIGIENISRIIIRQLIPRICLLEALVSAGSKKQKTLSLPVIIISGILLSILTVVLFLSLRFLTEHFSPTYKNAERYLREGKLDEAFAVSEKINGETTRKLLLRGKLFLARSLQGRDNDKWRSYGVDEDDWLSGPAIDSALSCFERVVQIDQDELAAHYFIGIVYKEKGWFDKAEEVLQEIIRRHNKYLDAHIALASLYTSEGKTKKALKHLYYAWGLRDGNPLIAKNIAYTYRFHLQQVDSAIAWFHRYLNIAQKGDIDIHYSKKELHELEARYPEFAVTEVQPWQQQDRKFIPRK